MTLEAKDKMESRFSPAPEVREVAKVLIKQHHSHLRSIRIEYVFDHHKKKSGKIVMGTMRIANGLAAYLAADDAAKKVGYTDPFFVMTIVKQIWDHLTEEQRTALVDAMMVGDGHWRGDSTRSGTYWTTSPQLADDFAVVSRCGKGTKPAPRPSRHLFRQRAKWG
jgi:hypothetical protein